MWGIVLAAGSGARFGSAKQFGDLGGRSLLEHSVATARTVCAGVVAVVPDPARAPSTRTGLADAVVAGGPTRSASVRAGLDAVPRDVEILVVADAAHPLASPALFAAVVAAVRDGADGAFPGLPLTEALARVGPDGVHCGSLPREGHVLVQMPQAFRAAALRAVHAEGVAAVEDSAMVAALTRAGRPARVVAVPAEATNVHVTTPAELEIIRRIASMVPPR